MITNNFKKILKCLFTYTNPEISDLNLIGLDNGEIKISSSDPFHVVPYLNTSLNTIIKLDGISSNVLGGVCMGFGSGREQVSLEDYNLYSYIDDLSYQSSSADTTEDGYIVTTSVKNNTSTDIIVSEVGLFGRGRNTRGETPSFMLTRNVLETPITIKPNETKTFTITINF